MREEVADVTHRRDAEGLTCEREKSGGGGEKKEEDLLSQSAPYKTLQIFHCKDFKRNFI